ncbi:UPF0481 protein At3g47200-like [Bidens hawaiensis]|uniref:UPF0481 protein At3g47200-like n=1 Tax=Bidens hawaiensis TaxID=980011 RepID=UPI004048F15C
MLAQQDQTQGRIEVTNDSIIDSIVDSGINATATSSPSLDVKIPRVPIMVREKDDYEKYYVPKVVSIGPYHFGKPKLQSVEKLKPVFAMKLLENNKETLRRLYNKLGEPQMVQDLRSYYEKDSTTMFCNKESTKMMLDGCFILKKIKFNYWGESMWANDCLKLKGCQTNLVIQDLFLLENQIPLKVLREVAWKALITKKDEKLTGNSHILIPELNLSNVSELVDVGIHFKPSDNILLSSVEFSRGWVRCLANVKLPRIIVNGSTRHMLLNMIAYETCLCSVEDAWVTSYVCLLDSLIDHAEDIKILRKSWVLDTSLGSDEEVAKMFNEMATDIAPNNWAYWETKFKIQEHYESWSNTLFPQLKNEYFKSPWAIFVLLGALLGLLLTAVQTYSSLTGECDDLCKFLKKNHHL